MRALVIALAKRGAAIDPPGGYGYYLRPDCLILTSHAGPFTKPVEVPIPYGELSAFVEPGGPLASMKNALPRKGHGAASPNAQ